MSSPISPLFRSTANAISNYSFDASSPTRTGGVGLSAMGGGGGAIKLDLADGVATGNGTKASLEQIFYRLTDGTRMSEENSMAFYNQNIILF